MRSTALTFVVITAAASLVSAEPKRDETTGRIRYNERASRPAAPSKVAPDSVAARNLGWIELASPTPASHGREFVLVGADAGQFTQLRLSAVSGRPEVYAVRVDYQDGSRRVFEVGRVLDTRRRPAYVELGGAHELKQIIVITDRRSLGSYLLEGTTMDYVAAR
jgi:hypothetical protein